MHTIATFRRKLGTFSNAPKQEYESLLQILGKPKILEKGEELRFEQSRPQRALLVAEGWAFTYRMLPTGARQIIDIAVPGDILGLRSLMLRQVNYRGTMLSASVVYDITANTMFDLFDNAPHVATGILWACSRDEALLVERLTSIGRRSAPERVLHFILELKARLDLVGKCNGASFTCPLSQSKIADTLALTPEHLNRVLRDLREMNVLHFHDGEVEIIDEDQALAIAQFDGTYLDNNDTSPAASPT